MSWKASVLAVALAAAFVPSFAHAQNNDGGNGGQGGGQRQRGQGGPGGGGPGGGGGNRFDPARMTEYMKEQLKAQDDEWRVIEPKLTKVVEAQRNARGGMGMMGGRRGQGGPGGGGGGPGGGGNQPATPLSTAQNELRTAIESDASSPEDIDKKLAAVRAARTDAQAKLEAARKDLKEVLTPKQEAQLVLLGILE
jgi:Spy/CpxP family protein refolding chaperone